MDDYEFLKAQKDEIINKRIERVAEIVYNFIHESQVTHHKTFSNIDADYRAEYMAVARKIGRVMEHVAEPALVESPPEGKVESK